jgi:hypothetical protein
MDTSRHRGKPMPRAGTIVATAKSPRTPHGEFAPPRWLPARRTGSVRYGDPPARMSRGCATSRTTPKDTAPPSTLPLKLQRRRHSINTGFHWCLYVMVQNRVAWWRKLRKSRPCVLYVCGKKESSGTIRVVVGESSLIRKVLTRRMEVSRGRQISTTDSRGTRSPGFCNHISRMKKKARTFVITFRGWRKKPELL